MSGSIRGRVRTHDGAPVVDATVVVSGVGPFPDIAPVSDDRGRFALDGLAEGRYALRVTAPDGGMQELSIAVADDSITEVDVIM